MREQRIEAGGHVFGVERGGSIEVSMLRRPDTSWRFTDAAGHVHAWHVNGEIAEHYNPTNRHELPTLRWIVESEATDDYPELGHHECVQCGERVTPRLCSDTTRQYVPGLSFFSIDGHAVTEDEFRRVAAEAGLI